LQNARSLQKINKLKDEQEVMTEQVASTRAAYERQDMILNNTQNILEAKNEALRNKEEERDWLADMLNEADFVSVTAMKESI